MTPRNYIPDNVRMETPPAWFLQQILDYDAELVLLPSRAMPYTYVIARRSFTARRGLVFDELTHPDTRMCMHYGLVPVCRMFKHGSQWNVDPVLNSLKARDLWAIGGGDKAADLIEAREAEDERKRMAAKREELYHLSGDAWRSYQARTGQRVSNPGPAHPGGASTAPTL